MFRHASAVFVATRIREGRTGKVRDLDTGQGTLGRARDEGEMQHPITGRFAERAKGELGPQPIPLIKVSLRG
jgi:hypothetical protein